MRDGKKLTVVMGGGGMKGLAHIGVLKVLLKYGLIPDEYVGTSVGAYIAALAAGGMPPSEIEEIAVTIRREDILDYDWLALLLKRSRARSLYRGKALHDFIRRTLPVDRFDQLSRPLYITSVDLDSSREVIWGMPGYTEIPIHDCVVASCSIPGIYPPKKINRYHFVDGGLVDSLPVKVAVYTKSDLIIAIHLDPPEIRERGIVRGGIAAILTQSQSILSRTMVRHNLHYFEKAPIVVIQPAVQEFGIFDFEHNAAAIRAGEEAAESTLRLHPLTRPLLPPAPSPPTSVPLPGAAPAGSSAGGA